MILSFFYKYLAFKTFLNWCFNSFNIKYKLRQCGKNSIIENPCRIESPRSVIIEENVNIRFGFSIINARNENVIIKRNTTIAPNVTIVTNNHVPTIGIPIFLLTSSHINDKSTDIVIEEDVWIGTNVTILAGASLGRGAIVGANALVTKRIPPYAVVTGIPARIVATRFSKEQIIMHEKLLYNQKDRLSDEYLDRLFAIEYLNLHSIGSSNVISEKEKNIIQTLKYRRNYIEP